MCNQPLVHPRTTTLRRVADISRRMMDKSYLDGSGLPVIVTDDLARQPAFNSWSFDLFKHRYGQDELELWDDIDRPEVKVTCTMSKYVDYIRNPEGSSLTGLERNARLYAYGYQPFLEHPELLEDIEDPYCIDNLLDLLSPAARKVLSNMDGSPAGQWVFIGPAGTVSHLHTDYTSAWLAQITGRKLCLLFSPEDSEYLYDGAVDPLRPDFDAFPLYANATPHMGTLEPGETLVMPQGWWHHVVAIEPSITVSFNFVTRANFGEFFEDILCDHQEVGDSLANVFAMGRAA